MDSFISPAGVNMTSETIPTEIDIYSIQEALGTGAYGITYLARDKAGRAYALKLLRSDAPSEGRQRMENEEHALRQIDHHAFPTFVRSGTFASRPYIVMSYAEGLTLRSWIDSNITEQSFFGGMRTLVVLERLLEGLVDIHKIPLLHRDIKDDNVIISTSGQQVTILDLGQCTGRGTPHPDITFWNIGAARFSPPSKLQNPSVALETHDVFSVGVTGYRMLTNTFPWEVPPTQDVGFLREKMQSGPPRPINEINSAVDYRISAAIMKMLEVEDFLRPRAETAIHSLTELRETLENEILGGDSYKVAISKAPLRLDQVIRDPLHGDVRLTKFEKAVIDTREFQRLRRIRQLGTAHLVYHGAEHTRFAHAVGTMEVADRIMRSIEVREGPQFSQFERQAARLFALVHDIAHAPFGHTLEDELCFFPRHDKNIARMERLIRHSEAELPEILQATDFGRVVLDLITNVEISTEYGWIIELVASAIGADVIDYVDRDALHCGLDHRVDSALYRSFVFVENRTPRLNQKVLRSKLQGRHGFRLDVDFAIGSILRERFALFMKAYSHPTKVAAGAMVGKALLYAQIDASNSFDEASVEIMGDEELLISIARSQSRRASRIAKGLINRKLYEPAYRARVLAGDNDDGPYRRAQADLAAYFSPKGRLDFEARLSSAAEVAEEDLIFYCSPKAPGAKSVSSRSRVGEGAMPARSDPLRDHTDMFRRHLELWNMYVFVHPDLPYEKRQLVARLMHGEFDKPNEVDISYRQLAMDW